MSKVVAVVTKSGLNLFGVVREPNDTILEDEYNQIPELNRKALVEDGSIRLITTSVETRVTSQHSKLKQLEERIEKLEQALLVSQES